MGTRRRSVMIAAGGGGDAIAAAMVADAGEWGDDEAIILSFAWERTLFDPRPGPRSPQHFARLRRRYAHNWQVVAASQLREPRAQSFLPNLASDQRRSVWLIDPSHGVIGLRRQLEELVDRLDVEHIVIVDVGGDILGSDTDIGVTSPTADAMVLAAAASSPFPVHVVVLGSGLDGEGSPGAAQGLDELDPATLGLPDVLPARSARRLAPVFRWSPSEATGLAYLAARGWRGIAEIRRDGILVELSADAARLRAFDLDDIMNRSRLARALTETASFDEVETLVRALGYWPEREIERLARLERRDADAEPLWLERELLHYGHNASARGVDFLTLRRIAEVLELSPAALRAFIGFLGERHRHRLHPPVWRLHRR